MESGGSMLYVLPLFLLSIAIFMVVPLAHGEEKSGDDLAAKAQNPVGAMYSLAMGSIFTKAIDFQ